MRPSDKSTWFAALEHEARRDLVFAWNIARGSFGGPKDEEGVPKWLFIEAVESLLEAGCKAGFGDPDSVGWNDLPSLNIPGEEKARIIADMWESHRQEYEFLVFALRP